MNRKTELYRELKALLESKTSNGTRKFKLSFNKDEIPLFLTVQYVRNDTESTESEHDRSHYYEKAYVSSDINLIETYLESITYKKNYGHQAISFEINDLPEDSIIIISGLEFSEEQLEYFINKLK
jgi:hypothetical protein